MVESVSRELILPAVRLDVPPRPTAQQLTALAGHSTEEWATSPRDWVTQQVVRLAVARVLTSRVTQPRPAESAAPGRTPLSTDPAEVTVGQLASLFRPHVDLAGQAFRLAVLEAVNAGVPAATEPFRDGLRRLGVTGRDPVRVVALGLDRVPPRARSEFWAGLTGSATLTAIVADLAAGSGREGARTRDVSGLDRSQLARADAIVLAGGRTTPVVLGGRPGEGGGWLQVPLVVGRRGRGPADAGSSRGGSSVVEVGLRGAGWVEVVDTTLEAITAAMLEIDLGSRPKGRRTHGLAEALAGRLVAAKDRTVAEVCDSLRAVHPVVLELVDEQVLTTPVPVAVPVPEEEQLVQLWLPGSALAAPLFTAAPDLYLGEGAEVRTTGGRPAGAGRPGKPGAKSGAKPGAKPGADSGDRSAATPGGKPEGPGGGKPGGRSRRGRGPRRTDQGAAGEPNGGPDVAPPGGPEAAPTSGSGNEPAGGSASGSPSGPAGDAPATPAGEPRGDSPVTGD